MSILQNLKPFNSTIAIVLNKHQKKRLPSNGPWRHMEPWMMRIASNGSSWHAFNFGRRPFAVFGGCLELQWVDHNLPASHFLFEAS